MFIRDGYSLASGIQQKLEKERMELCLTELGTPYASIPLSLSRRLGNPSAAVCSPIPKLVKPI